MKNIFRMRSLERDAQADNYIGHANTWIAFDTSEKLGELIVVPEGTPGAVRAADAMFHSSGDNCTTSPPCECGAKPGELHFQFCPQHQPIRSDP